VKHIFTITLLCLTLFSFAQENKMEFENLVKLSEIYSNNVNATGDAFKKAVEELRTPGLNHIVDALIAVGKGDKKLITKEFLTKPSAQELKYWYVIKEIHSNNQPTNSKSRPSDEVAKETLERTIDSRLLLNNYYYQIQGRMAKMFNDKNLS
jgi:hypothetical protein